MTPTEYSNAPTLKMVPPSIASVLDTAIPSDYYATITGIGQQYTQFEQLATSPPPWFSSLPSDVKSGVQSYVSYVVSEASKAGMFVSTTSDSAPSATGKESSSGSSDSVASDSSGATQTDASGSSSSQADASSSTSAGGAAAPTGPIAAGVVGAAGVLGLAIAL